MDMNKAINQILAEADRARLEAFKAWGENDGYQQGVVELEIDKLEVEELSQTHVFAAEPCPVALGFIQAVRAFHGWHTNGDDDLLLKAIHEWDDAIRTQERYVEDLPF